MSQEMLFGILASANGWGPEKVGKLTMIQLRGYLRAAVRLLAAWGVSLPLPRAAPVNPGPQNEAFARAVKVLRERTGKKDIPVQQVLAEMLALGKKPPSEATA